MTLRTGKSGRYRYYTCSRQAIQGKTGSKGRSIRMEKLDGLVLDEMAQQLFAADRLDGPAQRISRPLGGSSVKSA
jgi:hypothetical protein